MSHLNGLPSAPVVAALVLAAGNGTRFGSDKRLALLPNGSPMALEVIRRLAALHLPVFVVVKPNDPLPTRFDQSEGPNTIRWVECPEHAAGMGHSLSCGIQAVDQAGHDACLLVLADMPFIQDSTYKRLVEVLEASRDSSLTLARPIYNNIHGHPVGFTREWFGKLASSSGDEGARVWLKELKDQIHLIEVNDPGILKDVDRVFDLG